MSTRSSSSLLGVLALLLPLSASATTWVVDTGGGGDFTTIQAAIDASSSGDDIEVLPGAYPGAIDFLGKTLAVSSTGGPSVTTIDASWLSTQYAVTIASGEGAGTTLDGFTVVNPTLKGVRTNGTSPLLLDLVLDGLGATFGPGAVGSAMHLTGGSPEVVGCTVSGNISVAVEVVGGSPTFDTCTFDGNNGGPGAAIHVVGPADVTVLSSLFQNQVSNSVGSAIATTQGSLVLTGNTFVGNSSSGPPGVVAVGMLTTGGSTLVADENDFLSNKGGILMFNDCDLTLSGGSFVGNQAGAGNGGAVFLGASTDAAISDVLFDGNSASSGGALYAHFDNVVTLSGNTWTGNTATGFGGAIHLLAGGTLTGTGGAWADNSAASGGGDIYSYDDTTVDLSVSTLERGTASNGYGGSLYLLSVASATLTDVLVSDAYAEYWGGGIYADSFAGAALTLVDTTIEDCVAQNTRGGAVHVQSQTHLDAVGSDFTGNTAWGKGGAISSNLSSDVSLVGCLVDDNTVTSASGGGIYVESNASWVADVTIQDSVITNNSSPASGGGIHAELVDDFVLDGCTVAGNSSAVHGGGVYVDTAWTQSFTANTFCGNDAIFGGAASTYLPSGGVGADVWTNNVFEENTATEGGALYLDLQPYNALTNNTFVGNWSTNEGGAVYLTGTVTEFVNNAVAWTPGGSGVWGADASTSASTFAWCDWWENTADDVGGHLTSTMLASNGNLFVDPEFTAVSLDGDCGNDDLVPAPGSPLLDAGDPSISDPGGGPSDIGAYGGPGATLRDDDGDGWFDDVDCDDGDPAVHPDASEADAAACGDSIDNDCDDLVDAEDPDCPADPGDDDDSAADDDDSATPVDDDDSAAGDDDDSAAPDDDDSAADDDDDSAPDDDDSGSGSGSDDDDSVSPDDDDDSGSDDDDSVSPDDDDDNVADDDVADDDDSGGGAGCDCRSALASDGRADVGWCLLLLVLAGSRRRRAPGY